jgi:hypothetical protein
MIISTHSQLPHEYEIEGIMWEGKRSSTYVAPGKEAPRDINIRTLRFIQIHEDGVNKEPRPVKVGL